MRRRTVNMRLLMVAVPAVLFLGALVLVLAFGRKVDVLDEDTRDDDPVLARLRQRNPALHLARGTLERLSRIPVYWLTPAEGGERVLVPRSLVEGDGSAVLRLSACDPAAVPERLRYPRGTPPVCLTVEGEGKRLQAIFFRTDDALRDVVSHYDDEVGRLGSYVEESGRTTRLPDGSTALSHSYWMYERPRPNHQVYALVGFRREPLEAER